MTRMNDNRRIVRRHGDPLRHFLFVGSRVRAVSRVKNVRLQHSEYSILSWRAKILGFFYQNGSESVVLFEDQVSQVCLGGPKRSKKRIPNGGVSFFDIQLRSSFGS